MSRVWTIGYERLLPPELVAELQAAGKALGTPPDIRWLFKHNRPRLEVVDL